MNKWFAGCDNVKLFELHKNDSLRCRGWRQSGIVATLWLPVPKLSPGNTLHVLSQKTWQYITKIRWSMWSYSSITIDGGGSSIWRLGRCWWHPGLSLRQLMVPLVAAELSGWRPLIFGDGIGSRYITMYMYACVIIFANIFHVNLSNKRLLNLNLKSPISTRIEHFLTNWVRFYPIWARWPGRSQLSNPSDLPF